MFMEQVHEYISNDKFWTGLISGMLFAFTFVLVLTIKRANKNDWWQI